MSPAVEITAFNRLQFYVLKPGEIAKVTGAGGMSTTVRNAGPALVRTGVPDNLDEVTAWSDFPVGSGALQVAIGGTRMFQNVGDGVQVATLGFSYP